MSTFKVEIVEIGSIERHPNADRLDIVHIKNTDWQCITGRDSYKLNDRVIYIPIDSILSHEVESILFPPDSKVKLHNSRVKSIKLRGAISQGMIVSPETLGLKNVKVGNDVAQKLGIKKYEPPVTHGGHGLGNVQRAAKKHSNPYFHKYTGIENFKNYPKIFNEDEEIIATEKIHGTNFRAGWVTFHADTLWKKIKKFFGKAPKYEFVYGSHNVQLQSKFLYTGFYDKNVYSEAVKNYNLKESLPPNVVIYGEIYGDGIQKGYTYGCLPGERKLVVFDIQIDGQYIDHDKFILFCQDYKLPYIPILYRGLYNTTTLKTLATGNSILVPSQKTIEGIVIRPVKEFKCYIGRKILKLINEEYLLNDQTDFH